MPYEPKTISVHLYEVEELITWHMNEQYDAANKEEYAEASSHKLRVEELKKLLREAKEKAVA